MTEQEARTLVKKQLFSLEDKYVKVILEFQERPETETFRKLENISDRLMGEVLDAVTGTVIADTCLKFHAVPGGGKEKWACRGRQKTHIQLKHGAMQSVNLDYYLPVPVPKKGRPRRKGTRGRGGTGRFPFADRLGVIAHASPSLAEHVVLESLKDSYAEASESVLHDGMDMSWIRVQEIVNSVGKKGLEERKRRISCTELEPVAAGRRIAVSMDGDRGQIRTPHRGRKLESSRHGYNADWREPKLFLIYECDLPETLSLNRPNSLI